MVQFIIIRVRSGMPSILNTFLDSEEAYRDLELMKETFPEDDWSLHCVNIPTR